MSILPKTFRWHLSWPAPLVLIFFLTCVHRNRKEVYLGDDNALTLTFNARNEGEGGAYEAELYMVLPPETDYIGIARNNEVTRDARHSKNPQLPASNIPFRHHFVFSQWVSFAVVKPLIPLVSQSLSQLTCSYETENQTRYLSCDLGNPMKSGTNVRTHQPFLLLIYVVVKGGGMRCILIQRVVTTVRFQASFSGWVWTAQEKRLCIGKCYDNKYSLQLCAQLAAG